jgi:hypothetical protein
VVQKPVSSITSPTVFHCITVVIHDWNERERYFKILDVFDIVAQQVRLFLKLDDVHSSHDI